MNNRLVLFALHQMQGIGWKTVAGLVRQFPELSDIMMLKYVDWLELGLTPVRSEQVIKGMRELESGQMDRKLKLYEDRQIGWTCLWDADYPGLLRETAAPPWILYYRGRLELAHRRVLPWSERVILQPMVKSRHSGYPHRSRRRVCVWSAD